MLSTQCAYSFRKTDLLAITKIIYCCKCDYLLKINYFCDGFAYKTQLPII